MKSRTYQRTDPCVDKVCFSNPSHPAAWNAQFGDGQLNLSNNKVASIYTTPQLQRRQDPASRTHHFRTLKHDPELCIAEFVGFQIECAGWEVGVYGCCRKGRVGGCGEE